MRRPPEPKALSGCDTAAVRADKGSGPALSVVICTADRGSLLEGALESLAVQSASGSFEVVVVDNGSAGSVRAVAERFRHLLPLLCYVREPKTGLSHARNRGWQVARGRYIGYVDDDCRMPPDWAATALNVIGSDAPAVFGGGYRPLYEVSKPDWFRDEYESKDLGSLPRELLATEFLSGGNLFILRQRLQELGGFDASLGMVGRRLGLGEETALQAEIRRRWPNDKIRYDPRLEVLHCVPSRKLHLRYRLQRRFAAGRAAARERRIIAPQFRGRIIAIGKLLAVGLLLLGDVARCPFRRRRRYQYTRNYLYEHTGRLIGAAGVFWETAFGRRASPGE